MRFPLLLLLLASSAFAQPTVTRGGALKKRQYQTYANATYYVDPAGSDSNACTASGASACATLTGALGKLPRNINHAVTINIAAGTYVENPTIGPFTFGLNGVLTITGPTGSGGWAAFTPATGAATGTLTGYSGLDYTTATLGVLTDSAQSWTANDLRGSYVTITSGAASGTQAAIVSNDATSFTVNRTMLSLAAGATYAIQRPSAVITGTLSVFGINGHAASSAPLIVSDLTINGTTAAVRVQNVSLVSASGVTTASLPLLRRLRAVASAGTAVTCVDGALTTSSSTTYAAGSGSAGIWVRCVVRDQAGVWFAGESGSYAVTAFAVPDAQLGGTSTIPAYVSASTVYTVYVQQSRLRALYSAYVANTSSGTALWLLGSHVNITAAVRASSASGLGVYASEAAQVTRGAASAVLATGGAGDVKVDDVTLSATELNALNPKCVIGNRGSSFCE